MSENRDIPEFVLEALDETSAEPPDLADALGALALLSPAAPLPAGLKDRVLASAGAERYAPFFDRLARFLDLGIERVREIFATAADPARWRSEPSLGLGLFDFEAGSALAGADTGIVRIPAGAAFPEHGHLGRERVFLIEGGYRDSSGHIYRAGDFHEMAKDSRHSYVVLPESECVMVVALEGGGIEIGGTVVSV